MGLSEIERPSAEGRCRLFGGDVGRPEAKHNRAVAGVTTRAVAAATVCLLFVASPVTANGVTFPIAEGVSGPYEYEVGVGPFSPLRKALFVAITLVRINWARK